MTTNWVIQTGGYPARVSVSVNQYHSARTINGGEVTESEYDDLKWEKHEFYWSTDDDGVYNQLRLYIMQPIPILMLQSHLKTTPFAAKG